jgi:hypothetical protein
MTLTEVGFPTNSEHGLPISGQVFLKKKKKNPNIKTSSGLPCGWERPLAWAMLLMEAVD